MSTAASNDIENLLSKRLGALLSASTKLRGVQKLHPESAQKIKLPLIAIRAGVIGPAPGFEGSGMGAGVFSLQAMLSVTVHRTDSPDGLLKKLTGIVRDVLLAEIRAGLPTLNHEYADGRILKVWHMEMENVDFVQDTDTGHDARNHNLRLHAAVIEPEEEEE